MSFRKRLNRLFHRESNSQIPSHAVGGSNGHLGPVSVTESRAGSIHSERSNKDSSGREDVAETLLYTTGGNDERLWPSSAVGTDRTSPLLRPAAASQDKDSQEFLTMQTPHIGKHYSLTSTMSVEFSKVCPRCRKPEPNRSEVATKFSETLRTTGTNFCLQHIPVIERIRNAIEQAAGRPVLVDCNRPIKFYSPNTLLNAELLRVSWQLFGHDSFKLGDGYPLIDLSDSKYVLPGSTSSEPTFKKIRQWMNDCLLDHNKCHQRHINISKTMDLPSRVIDTRGGGVRIVDYDSSVISYACLSHCWGATTDFTKLTLATQDIFQNKIPESYLTKTFLDAIDICRRLSIKFLWIDSLCIIQDCAEDWEKEATKMASIFDKACLTIVATQATNSHGGCYNTTSDPYMTKLIEGIPLWFRQLPPPLYSLHGKSIETNALQFLPIFSRGWIFQELILSRRVLHFSPQEVLWHCRCCIRSESGESDMDFIEGRVSSKSWNWAVPLEEDDLVGPHREFTTNRPQELWHRTIEQYSPLKLTFGTDKLTAISAITRLFEDLRVGDQYIAGLWRHSLLEDLLWRVQPAERLQKPAVQRAPSWSWASVDSGVSWRECDSEAYPYFFTEIKQIRYVCEGEAHLGNSRESSLTLSGPLVETKVFRSYEEAHISAGIICTFDFGYQLEKESLLNWRMTAMLDVSSVPQLKGKFYPSERIFIAIIRADGHAIEGIILSKLEGLTQGEQTVYQRIGYGILSGVTETEEWASILPSAIFTIV